MERFIATQTKTNENPGESINLLTSRLNAMATHQKTMDAQIAQITQQVSHLSWPQGHFPSQPETNPCNRRGVRGELGDGLPGGSSSSSSWRNRGDEEIRQLELYWGD